MCVVPKIQELAIHSGHITRFEYDDRGRLTARRALVVDEYEGEVNEQEAWAWSYRYDCAAPRPDGR